MYTGRCYDHKFLQFFPILGEKIAFYLKTNVMIRILKKNLMIKIQLKTYVYMTLIKLYLFNYDHN
jgi:branched-subunit amino acid transport protein AzlD